MAAARVTINSAGKSRRHRAKFALAAAVAAVWQVRLANAQTDNWIAGDGKWIDPSNWDSGMPPTEGDSVSINFSDGVNRTVIYDYTSFPVTLSSLTLDLTNVVATSSSVISMSANMLSTQNEYLGFDGNALFNQSGGVNTAGTSLTLGCNSGSTGTYTLTGGMLTVSGYAYGSVEYVGESGNGAIIQSGGINYAQNLFMADNPGSEGTYTLSRNGSLSVTSVESIGINGPATFNQTGGTNTTFEIFLGNQNSAYGTYLLNSGALTIDANLFLDQGSTFAQTGGTLSLGTLFYGGGAFTSAGGTFSIQAVYQSGGVISSGATNGLLSGPLIIGTGGEFLNYSVAGGTLNSDTAEIGANGSLTITGGSFNGESITVNSGGTLDLSGGLLTCATININTGASFSFTGGDLVGTTINLDGGSAIIPAFDLDSGVPVPYFFTPPGVPQPAFNFSSGTLTSVTANLGYGTSAVTFSQTTGTLQENSLAIAVGHGSTATFVLSDNGTLSTGTETIGSNGRGYFNQSGGANTAATVNIAYNFTSTGVYILTGGSFSAGTENVAYQVQAVGSIAQSGGVNSVGTLNVGYWAGGTGTYTLSGTGTIFDNGSEYVGYGAGIENPPNFPRNPPPASGFFEQDGGLNDIIGVKGTLYLGFSSSTATAMGFYGGTGTYLLSGTGTLSVAGSEYVGYSGSGVFNQSGGVNTIGAGGLYLAYNAGSTGTYNLSGSGLISATGGESVGQNGYGSFNQSGGTNVASQLNIGAQFQSTAGFGVYSLSGGALSVSGWEILGYFGAGIFNQSGGLNTAGTLYLVYNSGQGTGSYTLSGGTLAVQKVMIEESPRGSASFTQIGGALSFQRFVQNGGTVSLPFLTLGAGGEGISYGLGAGVFTCPKITVNSGGVFSMSGANLVCTTFNLNGGTAYIPGLLLDGGSPVPFFNPPPGVPEPILNFSSGNLVASTAFLGEGTGSFNYSQTAGTFSTNTLEIANNPSATAAFNLSNAGSLAVSEEVVGVSGHGIFNQDGGTNTVGSLNLGNFGGTGAYVLSDTGSLIAGSEAVGDFGPGTFSQTGGLNSANSLQVGGNVTNVHPPDIYNLSGDGTLIVSGSETIGSFNQSGGSNIISKSGSLDLGYYGSAGAYTLSGNSFLSVSGSEFVGYGSLAIFNQSSGTNAIGTSIYLGYNTYSTGTYTLSGGKAMVGDSVFVGGTNTASGGIGVLNITGTNAELDVAGAVTVYGTPGSAFSISAGTVIGASLNLSGGTFTQSGGTAIFSNLTGSGTANITGGIFSLNLGGAPNQLGSLNISAPAILDLQLGGHTQAVKYDLINLTGPSTLGGTLELDLVNGFTPQIGEQFFIMNDATPFAGQFNQFTSNNGLFTYFVDYGPAHNLVEITVISVPEPGSLSLLIVGCLTTLRRRRRKILNHRGHREHRGGISI